MTSPVDTSVKFFHSGMPGAPTLAGVAGQLIALLDACLVNGFGALTLTSLTVSGGVATAAFAGTFPAVADSVVLISGATGIWSPLNGEQKVTALGSGTFQFATSLASGTATGTIAAKMAPAGWAKPFSGTNLAAYRSGDVTSNRFYLRVNDTNPTNARVVGYEAMTAISTGTNLFPTNAQQPGGGYWWKVAQAGAETVSWMVFANSKRFWVAIACAEQTTYSGGALDAMTMKGFGDFNSYKSTPDAYNTCLMSAPGLDNISPSIGTKSSGGDEPSLSIARLHTNVAGARSSSWAPVAGIGSSGYPSGFSTGSYLGPVTGIMNRLVMMQPVISTDINQYGVRGYWKEIWHTPQRIPPTLPGLAKGDIVLGVGAAAGRKLMAVPAHYTVAASVDTDSRVATFVDITGPWE